MTSDETEVVRVLFHTIDDGDRLKLEAVSNNSPTGGGARDLRFRPESLFLPFFKKLFPKVVVRKRNGGNIEVYNGPVYWDVEGQEKTGTMKVWPATDARADETRIATVSRFGFQDLVKDDPSGGRSIFMLFQQKSGIVRVYFTTETSLKNDDWHCTIKKFAREWFSTQKKQKSAFLDLEAKERFPVD